MWKNLRSLSLGAVFVSGLANAEATRINGAGATFPAPIYMKWFSEFQKKDPDTQINYQSVGSGAGIQYLLAGTVDFGASDAPMTDAQISQAGSPKVLHLPTVLGAVVLTYNLPGLSAKLRLDGPTIAAIYLGQVTKWNDARVAALNPGVKLPDQDITVVSRSDGSGTSAIFSDYLSKASPEWAKKVGKGTALKWPVGIGGKGNEGVTGAVKGNPGALGYVELIYAVSNNLPYASVKNHDGAFVDPSVASLTAAAAGATVPADYRVSITDASGKDAYPISGLTYLLVRERLPAKIYGKFQNFLRWALTDGQRYAASMNYAPLPQSLAARVRKTVDAISVVSESPAVTR